jgi:EmrB/QacA subfamily drug resistance transporter
VYKRQNFQTVQWVVLAYLLTLATLLLSVGRWADMKGKKRIYSAGFIIFTIGSLLCGVAPNILSLIVFRVIQALGATMILSLGMAIVTEAFPPSERGMALGITGTMVSIGIVIGPTVGGLIIDALSWNWIFFVNLPIGIIGVLMVLRFVPSIHPTGNQRFDIHGAICLFLSLLSFALALTLGQSLGFTDIRIMILFLSFIGFLAAFLFIEYRIDDPMIDLGLFRNRAFSNGLVTGFITFVAIAGTTILMPFYLENVLGYSTRQVGILIAALPISMGLVAPIAGTLSDRFGTRPITLIGLAILSVGYLFLSTLTSTTTTTGFVLRFLPIGIGMGIFQSPNNSAIMGIAPKDRLGTVSGMLAVNRTLGQTTGIAVLGAIWASRVFHYSGSSSLINATDAPVHAQVSGLQDAFYTIVIMLVSALGYSLLSLRNILQLSHQAKGTKTETTRTE